MAALEAGVPERARLGRVVLWLVAFRYQRRLAILLTPMITGLIVATVYGRFHYVLDTIAGVGLAFAVVANWRSREDQVQFPGGSRLDAMRVVAHTLVCVTDLFT